MILHMDDKVECTFSSEMKLLFLLTCIVNLPVYALLFLHGILMSSRKPLQRYEDNSILLEKDMV